MNTEVIKADTIDEAVKRILEELKEEYDDATRPGRRATGSIWHNVIYFDGWDGLGASAVLRAIFQRLNAGQEFSQIIHIDCSKWESRRAVQRALAVKLKLPTHVIGMLDAQDEEDDYRGVGQGSRLEIPKVSREIYEHVQKQLGQRFLVIFNNGSCEEIDLESFGFPLSGYSRNKALWSFQGGFRLYPRMKVDRALESKGASSTDVVLSATSSNIDEDKFSDILRHEAEEVAQGIISTAGGIDWPKSAAKCFLYTMRLCGMGGHLIDYNLDTHGCNYWICDGRIQLQQGDVVGCDDAAADTLWQSCDALKREMRLDADYHQSPQLPASPVVRRLLERMAYWTSPAYGSTLIKDQHGHIPKGMFQQYDKLCVLKLSACTFSLTSPPFVCCHSLRFLWLDHCREEESSSKDDGAANEEDVRQCFQKLWVLDVRYSSSKFLSEKVMDFMAQLRELHVMGQEEFDMDTLQGRVRNIRKLRVTKSNTNCYKGAYLLSGKDKMEHLELSGNGGSMKSLSVESSSCSSLDTVIIDTCFSLEEISLKGWTKPENLILIGSFPKLCSLDLSGAAVKTLDLSAVMAPKLDELLLLDCVKLTAILWPKAAAAGEGKGSGKRYLGKLRIDTTGTKLEYDMGSSRQPAECSWYICVRDTRLLRSLEPVKDYFGDNDVHLDISTRTLDAGRKLQADDSAIMSTACPPAPGVSSQGCYMHIEDTNDAATAGGNKEITIPGFICDGVKTLHVHDSKFVTRIVHPADLRSKWDKLEWCRVERCPKLICVFSSPSDCDAFGKLRTIWMSNLKNARCIMDLGSGSLFSGLTSLHLYRCPTLIYALPWFATAFNTLENLEIMWCGNLKMVLNADMQWYLGRGHPNPWWSIHPTKYTEQSGVLVEYGEFFQDIIQLLSFGRDIGVAVLPKLKHLSLHKLPNLDGIVAWQEPWEYWRYSMIIRAPNLETVKIRGCWRLEMLPIVLGNKMVSCDWDWWDNKLKENKNPFMTCDYEPIHSQH